MIVPYIGEVTVFAFSFAPAGSVTCDGALLPISENTGLFSLIGNNFGGDGVSTFGLPNFSSLTEEGGQYCMSLFGTMPPANREAIPGELALLPYNAPPSWVNCDGQLLQISQYPALFQILMTRFGGDGTTTFGLPDLRTAPPLLPKGQPGAPPLPPSIYSIATAGDSSAQGIVAEVKLFPSACAPNNWSACDGRLLPVASNTALFSLLQTTYGGDGQTNFALPDFSKLSPPGLEYFICTVGVYPSHPEMSEQ